MLIILLKVFVKINVARHGNKKSETCGIKYKFWEWCPEYTDVKDDLIECKGLYCNKNYQKMFDKV